jgi:L-iditol 2-dehydrogenase
MLAAVLIEPGRIEMEEDTWPTAIALVESGRVDLDAMVTARVLLEKAAEALDSDRTPGSVKSVVAVS